ncbi:MAG: argininosuccinate lyase [Burkholderiales bacterium]|nr:argininosuccinate lyase [Burkholderiales bacterium]
MTQAIAGSEFYQLGATLEPIAVSSAGHDAFHWVGEMNKASAVMLVERGIVAAPLGRRIAEAVRRVIEDAAAPGADRPGNYMVVESLLVAAGGMEVTRVHSGRSRQDMVSTSHRLFLRDQLLDCFDGLAQVRTALLALAQRHRDDVVPAYTHNVQAQPTSFGHYLGAFLAAFERNASRMREAWARVNLSPLGAGALGTSSFPIDRPRLAQLLGFEGVVDNAYDANHVAPCDLGVELAGIAASGALSAGALLGDILGQYRQTSPWITLREGALTGTSTMMPQKRNPTALLAARHLASKVLAEAQGCLAVAHNIGTGLLEHRGNEALETLRSLARLHALLAMACRSLALDAARALDEVEADYSTTTELADVLQREADVPFRVGHHFASELVNYGRGGGLRPAQIPFEAARRIYAQTARAAGMREASLPLGEARFREALSAKAMIAASRGRGGPQPDEVARMLEELGERERADREWLGARRRALREASERLELAFVRLMP